MRRQTHGLSISGTGKKRLPGAERRSRRAASFRVLAIILSLVGVSGIFLNAGCARRTAPLPAAPPTYVQTGGGNLQVGAWQSELPADIVLVLDQSASMSRGTHPTDPQGQRVRDSASLLEFVASRSTKAAPNRFGVVNFGTTAPPQDAVPLTPITSLSDPSLSRLRRQLRPMNLQDTSFIAALRQANRMLSDAGSFRQPRNRAIIVFTDGEPDDERRLTRGRYFAELNTFAGHVAKPEGVRLFIVGIDTVGKNWSASAPYWRRVVGANDIFTATDFQALRSQFNRIVQRVYHLPEVPPIEVVPPQKVDFSLDPYLSAVEFHIFSSRQGVTLDIYRPNGAKVRPGQDADVPPVKQLSTFQRLVVYSPQPGIWHYEATGGRVTVLRNPIPLRMALVSPARVHPRGKPMTLVAQFQRADGQPVRSDPDYPLGLSAEVTTPDGRRIPVKFPLDSGQGGTYTGIPVIQNTMVGGDYQVILKVNGGGKYEDRYPVAVQVRDVPYLQVDAPSAASAVLPGASLPLQARLMEAGKPLLPQNAFSNHPDELVMAQVLGGGSRANKVYVNAVPDASGNATGEFSGNVPMPSTKPGSYALVVALAPEEKGKQAVADETAVGFAARYPAPPWWRPWLLWGLPTLLLLAALVALLRKQQRERLRLPFYYWPEGQSTKTAITLTQADEQRDLAGLPIRLTRMGSQKRVRLQPIQEAELFRTDGTRVPLVETETGGLLQVRAESGAARGLSYGFNANIPQPKPARLDEAPLDEVQDQPLAEEPGIPAAPEEQIASSGGSDWDTS